MKSLLGRALSGAGIYYAKRQYMPVGLDWLWDIHRLAGGRVKTVFDVGANIGQTTRAIKEQFPDAHVHAFEPVGATYQSLQSAVGQLTGVTCHRIAFSDRIGQAVMTAGSNSLLNHLVASGATPDAAGVEEVETDTLDHFCEVHRIERIDLLKVDAEGADLKVLQGAARMLREQRVALVFVETGFKRSDHGHVHLSHLLEHAADSGLEPYCFYDYNRLQPPTYDTEGLGLVFANVLFVSPAAIGGRR